ncbi:Delta3-Delta2-enoyl-CoA isomerase [Trichoderma asperellum]|nr:putative peroxisomal d3,d2-enoyl-CoA isomerase [Trichoderma asperelloides]
MPNNAITVDYNGRIAVITLNQPEKLNSFNEEQFYFLGECLREIAKHDEVTITLLIGTGRFFSSGADVSDLGKVMAAPNRKDILAASLFNNVDLTRAFYTHPKILVVGLNGPVVGFPAALISFADFIYARPHAYLLLPFSSLGFAAEGGASRALRDRLGVTKTKEALMMSKRIPSDQLLACGFVNKILQPLSHGSKAGGADPSEFLQQVLKELDKDLGSHLNDSSLLDIKTQFFQADRRTYEHTTVQEAYTAVEKMCAGIPQKQMQRIAAAQKTKSKL